MRKTLLFALLTIFAGTALAGPPAHVDVDELKADMLLGLNDANGDPFNGTLFAEPIGIIVSTHQHTLPAGAFEIQRERTTRSCTGGIVSARTLRAEGLTEAQIKDFFKEPMTICFGTQGNVSRVDYAQFFAGIRIYGDK